jgi:hypothetical protein
LGALQLPEDPQELLAGHAAVLDAAWRATAATLSDTAPAAIQRWMPNVARLSAYLRRHINIHGHYTVALPDLGGRHRVLRDPDQARFRRRGGVGQPTRTAGGMGLPGAGPSGHPERLPVGVCACGSQFSIMLKSRALHEHDRRLVGFRADAIVIMFEKRCREVRVSKNLG